jgi:uncharacterized paraquat-inducible protein A
MINATKTLLHCQECDSACTVVAQPGDDPTYCPFCGELVADADVEIEDDEDVIDLDDDEDRSEWDD